MCYGGNRVYIYTEFTEAEKKAINKRQMYEWDSLRLQQRFIIPKGEGHNDSTTTAEQDPSRSATVRVLPFALLLKVHFFNFLSILQMIVSSLIGVFALLDCV